MRPLAVLWVSLLGVLSSPVLAHPGHAEAPGFAAGLVHPFVGIDHLLAMVLVAWWAQLQSGAQWWRIPLGFSAGLAAGTQMPATTGTESWVAVSVLLLGLLILRAGYKALSPSFAPMAPLLALWLALPHGMAHATDLSGSAWLPGMLCASTLLHLAGGLAGRELRAVRWPHWLAGGSATLAGILLLAPV